MELEPYTALQLLEKHYPNKQFAAVNSVYENSSVNGVIITDLWCRCEGSRFKELHSIEDHHPRFFDYLRYEGIELAFEDTYTVDYDESVAYEAHPTHHGWQPGWILLPDADDYLFAGNIDHHDELLEYAANNGRVCVPKHWNVDMSEYTLVAKDFESGLHPGMTDQPEKILDQYLDEDPEGTYVFVLTETSQFYITFALYRKNNEDAK